MAHPNDNADGIRVAGVNFSEDNQKKSESQSNNIKITHVKNSNRVGRIFGTVIGALTFSAMILATPIAALTASYMIFALATSAFVGLVSGVVAQAIADSPSSGHRHASGGIFVSHPRPVVHRHVNVGRRPIFSSGPAVNHTVHLGSRGGPNILHSGGPGHVFRARRFDAPVQKTRTFASNSGTNNSSQPTFNTGSHTTSSTPHAKKSSKASTTYTPSHNAAGSAVHVTKTTSTSSSGRPSIHIKKR